jgi:hypothetical protein
VQDLFTIPYKFEIVRGFLNYRAGLISCCTNNGFIEPYWTYRFYGPLSKSKGGGGWASRLSLFDPLQGKASKNRANNFRYGLCHSPLWWAAVKKQFKMKGNNIYAVFTIKKYHAKYLANLLGGISVGVLFLNGNIG